MRDDDRRFVVDTDTATDDALALLLLGRTPGVDVAGVTVVAGNAPFEREVENAKHALGVAGRADSVPVYEGAREPLAKEYEYATEIHGEGGLGGDLAPETGVPSAEGHAAEFLVRTVRESPGEVTLVCVGPLTNVALALALDPGFADAVGEVYAMGGAVHTQGNVTPAAEYNFWVDPDAAARVVRDLDVTLVDWGLCTRRAVFDEADLDRFAGYDTPYGEFFDALARPVLRRADVVDGVAVPDLLTAAVAVRPDLVTDAVDCHLDVDTREGLTRGHTVADTRGTTDREAGVTLVRDVDEGRFRAAVEALVRGEDPPFRS